MSQWSSDQYLKFKSQKTKFAIDLGKRIPQSHPKNILDIGCGPGNSTSVLKKIFPQACILLGVDNSEDMIRKAKEVCLDMDFQVYNITARLG